MTTHTEIPDDLIEIRDPEIDPTQIMQEIRSRVAKRRQEAGYEEKRFPTYGGMGYPGEPTDIPYDPNFYTSLREANEQFSRFDLGANLASSPTTRLPLIGGLWARLRREVHNLVLFYVNRSARQQITVNRALVQVVNQLAAQSQEQQRQVEILKRRVQELSDGGAQDGATDQGQ